MFESFILLALTFIVFPGINTQFQHFVSHVDSLEQTTLSQNLINSFEKLDDYFSSGMIPPGTGTHAQEQSDVSDFELETAYPGYTFSSLGYHETSDASGAIPIDFGNNYYSNNYVVGPALTNNGITTSYAGCGPNAMIGIFDYFARYMGYSTIISDVNNQTAQYNFVNALYGRCTTYDVSFFAGQEAIFMTPWDYVNAFNQTASACGVQNLIVAHEHWTVLGMKLNDYWDIVTENIDKGLPVTLMTTAASGSGEFGAHYSNIYGYEVLRGVNAQNQTIERKFIKAKLNHNYNDGYYCDARILNDPLIGLITYDMPVAGYETMHASDTANVFVNANGGGQYFFDVKMADVNVNGNDFSTYRLRTSYIENQYLVLSPNRIGAGEAYLHIFPLGRINFIQFDAGMWGYYEGISDETFTVEAFIGGTYRTITTFDLSQIGWKEHMTSHIVLLPYNTYSIVFRAIHSNPISTTNKGRICLENIRFSYTYNS